VDYSAGGMGGVAVLDAHSSCTANFDFFLDLVNSQAQDVTSVSLGNDFRYCE